MHDRIQWTIDMEIIADVVFQKTEAFMAQQMSDIFWTSRNEIIEANDIVPMSNQMLAKVIA
jgi:hypothetical protein